jgi:hypothetical protein
MPCPAEVARQVHREHPIEIGERFELRAGLNTVSVFELNHHRHHPGHVQVVVEGGDYRGAPLRRYRVAGVVAPLVDAITPPVQDGLSVLSAELVTSNCCA